MGTVLKQVSMSHKLQENIYIYSTYIFIYNTYLQHTIMLSLEMISRVFLTHITINYIACKQVNNFETVLF